VEKSFERMVDFLLQFRICKDISRAVLNQMSFYLSEKRLRRRDILFREGDMSEGIYFVKEGDFEVTKTMSEEEVPQYSVT